MLLLGYTYGIMKEVQARRYCVMNELGTYIKEKRTEKGLSIRRLAELSDISHTEAKRIEDGLRKQTSPQVLRSIA